jgi:hypothetical protein
MADLIATTGSTITTTDKGAELNLSGAQTADVGVGDVAGGNVTKDNVTNVRQGMDPAPVIDLLGDRIERQLDRLVQVNSWSVTATAMLVLVQVLALILWGSTVLYLLQPHLSVAGR